MESWLGMGRSRQSRFPQGPAGLDDPGSKMALTAELVARCERVEPDPGPQNRYDYFTEEDYDQATARMLAQHGSGPLWVFAYGSLLWKPEGQGVEHRRGRVRGWHRAFCLELKRWRGSPQQPGLMMGLRRGGSCDGMIYRLPEGDHAVQLGLLLRREVGSHEDLSGARWLNVETEEGRVRALTFWAEPKGADYWVTPPLDEVARILAKACGHLGSGAAYLFHTVTALEKLGIRDRNLWRLQEMVAVEIKRFTEGTLGP